MMVSPRTELAHINKHLHWFQTEHGEVVLWYELDGKASTYDDTFNVRGKVWREPIAVPVLWVISTEDTQESVPEGRRNVGTLQFNVSLWEFRRLGISDPYDWERHQNDMVAYGGDFYSVGEYSLLGRLDRDDVILAINAIKVYPEEELVGSEIPDADKVAESKRPPMGLNNTAPQEYVFHPPPAPQAVPSGTIAGGFSWATTPVPTPPSTSEVYGGGFYGSGPYGGVS